MENPVNMEAPLITKERLDYLVAQGSITYYRFPDTTITICNITLANGFSLIGKSACVSADNFDALKGEQRAFMNAKEKLWELEGYLLAQTLHESSKD